MKPESVRRIDTLLKSRQWWRNTDRSVAKQALSLPLSVREDLSHREDATMDGAQTVKLASICGHKYHFILQFLVAKNGREYREEYVSVRAGQQYMAKALILVTNGNHPRAEKCLIRRTVPFTAGERIYDLVGGIRRPTESLTDTLVREIKQQTGIISAKLNLLTYSLLESDLSDVKMLVYAATVTSDQIDLDHVNDNIRALGTELVLLTPEDFQEIKSANMPVFAAFG